MVDDSRAWESRVMASNLAKRTAQSSQKARAHGVKAALEVGDLGGLDYTAFGKLPPTEELGLDFLRMAMSTSRSFWGSDEAWAALFESYRIELRGLDEPELFGVVG